MLSYCLKSRKNTGKVKIQRLHGQKMEEKCFYQNMKCGIVKIG